MKRYISIRIGKQISFLFEKRGILVFFSLLVLLIAIFFISVGMGDSFMNPSRVFSAMFGNGTDFDKLIINEFRLPRIILAILIGMSLAVAGSILQGLVKNPLASPDIIGITGGASVAVVLFLALFSDTNNSLTVSIKFLPLAAFIGALIVTILVYMLARNGLSSSTLILVGVGFWALTKALTSLFMLFGPIYQVSQANVWLVGSVYGASWENVYVLLPWSVSIVFIVVILSRHMNVQNIGDEIAIGVGVNVAKYRIILLFLSAGLVGGAVAFGGGIGFVGLMAPHIARKLVGSSYESLLPVSACVGALLVLIADTLGRTLFTPIEVPTGVFTAAIGAPYFIYLLYQGRK